jgi:hypothetical protein
MYSHKTFEIRYLGVRHPCAGPNAPRPHYPVTPTNQLPTYLTPPTQAQLDALPLTLNMLKAEPSNSLAQFGVLSNITSFQSWGSSTYNGLAVQGTRRFAAGLRFVASYTGSHLIDNPTADVFSTVLTPRRPQDFQNFANERSHSALDRRQRFTLQPAWDLPFYKSSENWYL